MANRKQRHTRADVKRIHTQTEINRRLYRASNIAFIMHLNMLHESHGTVSPSYIAAIFSYLSDDLYELQQLVGTHTA